jgi:phosphopantothenoylcysteine decarboxylase/phosphopantothenate--cysteine ligase
MIERIRGRTVVVGITGGIAAYKAVELCSALVQKGAHVHVIMTVEACKFVTPLTLQAITRQRVMVDTFAEDDPTVIAHVDIADRADAVMVVPATAHFLAKFALGLADDMLSTTMVAIGSRVPILVAPAMNVHMYRNAVVTAHLDTLRQRGVHIFEPEHGFLACGYEGKGRMVSCATLLEGLAYAWGQPLAHRRVLITAGATIERLDPVRYLTNDSSGKMGVALAHVAHQRGADVLLVHGRMTVPLPAGVQAIEALSAEAMREVVLAQFATCDIAIMAAAVSDYRPAHVSPQKIKKNASTMTLALEKTPDILREMGQMKTTQMLVGFAAETQHVPAHAMQKLTAKNCDFIVANDVSIPNAGFYHDDNAATLYGADGSVHAWPLLPKPVLAAHLWDVLVAKREAL